jgi:transcriptional regulator with XRE-family HTH domain
MGRHITLRELRERQEWTQAKIAEIAGVDIQVIQDIEAGMAIDWAIATRITVKIKTYLGNKAVEGLDIPQKEG